MQLGMTFDARTAVRNTDPDTSYVSAYLHPSLRAHDRRAALLAHAAFPDGLTDFELADVMHRQQTSAGKRRGELRDLGYVADSGWRRLAPSGAPAIVWVITDDGLVQAGLAEMRR